MTVFLVGCSTMALADAKKANREPASDSAWLFCKNTKRLDPHSEFVPLMNVFEHRNGAAKRQTDLVLIYGGHLLTGQFDNTEKEEGTVELNSREKDESFNGTVTIDYAHNNLWLKGKVTLAGSEGKDYQGQLSCERMN